MGLFNTIRKKLENENAQKYMQENTALKIDIQLNKNAHDLIKEINKLHKQDEAKIKKRFYPFILKPIHIYGYIHYCGYTSIYLRVKTVFSNILLKNRKKSRCKK